MSEPTYEQLRAVYEKRFTLGYLNMDINNKFALISLVGYLTMKVREKNPTATHLSVLNKINADLKLPQDFINALAIVCEDFSYGCKLVVLASEYYDEKEYIRDYDEFLKTLSEK